MTLGEALFSWRKTHVLTQADVAEKIGVEAQTIANLEQGRTKTLKTKFLRKLKEAMGPAFPAGADSEDGEIDLSALTVEQIEALKRRATEELERRRTTQDLPPSQRPGDPNRRPDLPPRRPPPAPTPPTREDQEAAGQAQDIKAKMDAALQEQSEAETKKPGNRRGRRAS